MTAARYKYYKESLSSVHVKLNRRSSKLQHWECFWFFFVWVENSDETETGLDDANGLAWEKTEGKRERKNEPYQLRNNTLGRSTGSHENVSDSPWNKIQKPLTPVKTSSGNMWILLHFISILSPSTITVFTMCCFLNLKLILKRFC